MVQQSTIGLMKLAAGLAMMCLSLIVGQVKGNVPLRPDSIRPDHRVDALLHHEMEGLLPATWIGFVVEHAPSHEHRHRSMHVRHRLSAKAYTMAILQRVSHCVGIVPGLFGCKIIFPFHSFP